MATRNDEHDMRQLRETLRRRALDLGFACAGFTDASDLACGPLLSSWLAAGRHGDMDWLGRDLEQRLRPRARLAGASSVLVVGWPYRPAAVAPPRWRQELRGRIAAYALGADYHDHMQAALERLAVGAAELGIGAWLVQVDSGPLVEKELARRAGLGWYGHNTNLLTKAGGSWLLLGCLLLEAPLPPDPPFEADHCGTCRACVPACPTDALGSGETIDAPRCISYATIEHRGPIATDLRAAIGPWVFGCDVCQEVCPWNDPAPAPDPRLEPYLPELLELDEDGFRARFGGTAIARSKRRGLARNAAVVLGNTGNPAAIEVLEKTLLEHDEAIVRAHAAWALGRLAAEPPLRRALGTEIAPPVRREILGALDEARASAGNDRKSPWI